MMGRSLAILFWVIFAANLAIHFWIGDVVVETKQQNGAYQFMLREARGEWISVSTLTYWAHYVIRYLTMGAVLAILMGATWAWFARQQKLGKQ